MPPADRESPRPDERPSASNSVKRWGHAAIASWAVRPAKHSLIALPRYARYEKQRIWEGLRAEVFVRLVKWANRCNVGSAAYLRLLSAKRRPALQFQPGRAHPAIITRAEHEAVLARSAECQHGPCGTRKPAAGREPSLYRSILRCGACGLRMWGTTRRSSVYYQCQVTHQ